MTEDMQILTEDQVEAVDGGVMLFVAALGVFIMAYQSGYTAGSNQCRVAS